MVDIKTTDIYLGELNYPAYVMNVLRGIDTGALSPVQREAVQRAAKELDRLQTTLVQAQNAYKRQSLTMSRKSFRNSV